MCFKATNVGRGGVAVDAGRDADARESRARALIVGRSVGVLVRDPSVVVDARSRSFVRVRSFVRSFVRQRENVLNRIESKSSPFARGIGRRSTVRSRDTARWGFSVDRATRARRIGEKGTTVGAID